VPKLTRKIIINKVVDSIFYLILFLLSLGQIARFSFGEYPIYMYLYELFLVVFIILLSFKIELKKILSGNTSIIIFLSWILFGLLISSFSYKILDNIVALLYTLRLSAYFIYLIIIKNYFKKNKDAKHAWNVGIVFFLAITIVFSFVQYFLYPNIGNLAYLGWDPHLYRMVGSFFEPQLAVAIYGLLFLYIFFSTRFLVPDSVARQPQKMSKFPHLFGSPRLATPVPRLKNVAKILVTSLKLIPIVLMLMIFLTVSRGGITAFVITLLFIFREKLKLIILSLLIVTVIFIVIPKPQSEGLNILRTSSIQTRLIDYQKAFKIWKKSPILGIGYNHIRFEKDKLEEKPLTEKYNPSHASSSFHSSFLIILATTGVIGLAIYLWVLWSLAKMSDFSSYATVFLSLASIFDNVLLHPFILFLYFTMIVLSQVIHPSHESR